MPPDPPDPPDDDDPPAAVVADPDPPDPDALAVVAPAFADDVPATAVVDDAPSLPLAAVVEVDVDVASEVLAAFVADFLPHAANEIATTTTTTAATRRAFVFTGDSPQLDSSDCTLSRPGPAPST